MLGYQRVNLHFPMVFLWFSYGFPGWNLRNTNPPRCWSPAPARASAGTWPCSWHATGPMWRCWRGVARLPRGVSWPRSIDGGLQKLEEPQELNGFWVNYNELTATSLEIMVSKGNHPQMAARFRLVNYYNLPRWFIMENPMKMDDLGVAPF